MSGIESASYSFFYKQQCDMCGSPSESHRILGQRLNCSQGTRPRLKSGISVSIVKCLDCGLIYSNPQPIPVYPDDHDFIDAWADDYFEYSEDYMSWEIEKVKELISFKPGMKVLDIGAGIGKGLRSLENAGFRAFGIEPSKSACRVAIEKIGIAKENLQCSTVENAIFDSEKFDFINFGAVLEHLYSPSDALRKSLRWLKPGGVIFGEIPNSDYFVSKLLNLYNKLWLTNYVTHTSPMHAPFHHFEFTKKTFEKFCIQSDCEIAFHKVFVCKTLFIPSLFVPIVDKYMSLTDTGMQHSIFIRKKAA